jgi:hypothetical protein
MSRVFRVAAFRDTNQVTTGELSTTFLDLASANRCKREFVERGEYAEAEIHVFPVDADGAGIKRG